MPDAFPLGNEGAAWFLDSCSHYAAAAVGQKYAAVQGTPALVAGRDAGSALRFDGGTTTVEHAFSAGTGGADPYLLLCFGASVRLDGTTWGTASEVTVVQAIKDRQSPAGRSELTQLRVRPDGSLAVYSPSTLVAEAAAGALPSDTWVFLEVGLRSTATYPVQTPLTGECVVRVNGTVQLAAAGVAVADGATPEWQRVRFGNHDAGTTLRLDVCDVCTYLLDFDTPGTLVDLLAGDAPVRAYLPDAAGLQNEGTPVGAATSLDAIDEPVGDGDATYVHQGGTAAARENYRFGGAPELPLVPLPPAQGLNGQVCALTRATAAGQFIGIVLATAISPTTIGTATPLTTYFYVRGVFARRDPTVLGPYYYGVQWSGLVEVRVSQVVIELRGNPAARTWVGWLGT